MKLLLAEDEKLTRDGIRKSVNWGELGIDEIVEAIDGVEAISIAQSFKPDIVLTDIKMPRMNGVDFAFQIRQIYPSCKIVFMSGYAEKEYLKAAITLKAISYVEKPLEMEELESALKDAVELCLEEQNQVQQNTLTEEKLHASSSLIKQEIALQLIRHSFDQELLTRKLDWTGIDISLDCPCLTIIVKFIPPMLPYEIVDSSIQESAIRNKCLVLTALKDELHVLIHLFAANRGHGQNQLSKPAVHAFCSDLSESMKRHDLRFAISVGSKVEGAALIKDSYASAVLHLQETFYKGPFSIVIQTDPTLSVVEETYPFNRQLIKNFRDSLAGNDFAAAKGILNSLHTDILRLPNTLVNNVKEIYYQLLLDLDKFAKELGIALFGVEKEGNFLWELILDCHYAEEILSLLIQKIDQLQHALSLRGSGGKASKIVKYIHQHYANDELSVQEISDHLQMTASHLISIFKEATGKTIKQYVMDVRIEKAKSLLKNDRLKIFDVASQVGFKDGEYFSRIFRKHTGLTPSEYRERYDS
jgi:two-component system response regulator YesN